MKKSRAETAKTRHRIVKAAAAEFRRNGIQSTSLAEVMAAAGLTQGGFYRHFDSKDQLVAEACTEAMASAIEVTQAAPGQTDGKAGFAAIVENFLSTDHRNNCLGGCPLVGLGIELARADDDTRTAASDGFVKLVELIAKQIRHASPEAAKARAIFALSAMIGAVTMSRIVTDTELSATILREVSARLAKI
jgi:TetR/AcrR family transcriptional regulator, transcriptional repressor for nem operon